MNGFAVIDLPGSSVAAQAPVVLEVRVVGDGRVPLHTCYVEVPVPTDRRTWNQIALQIKLADDRASVAR